MGQRYHVIPYPGLFQVPMLREVRQICMCVKLRTIHRQNVHFNYVTLKIKSKTQDPFFSLPFVYIPFFFQGQFRCCFLHEAFSERPPLEFHQATNSQHVSPAESSPQERPSSGAEITSTVITLDTCICSCCVRNGLERHNT